MSKRGNPQTLSPEMLKEMERLWVHTCIPIPEIAVRLNALFGTTLEARKVEWHARRREWRRESLSRSNNHPVIVQERLFTAVWERWAEPRRDADVVRRVAPGTFPAARFSMLGKRVV